LFKKIIFSSFLIYIILGFLVLPYVLKSQLPQIVTKQFIYIKDGSLNSKMKIRYSKSDKKPNLSIDASLSLNKLFINDTRDSKTIFSIDKFGLESIDLKLLPNGLNIGNLDINSCFIDTIIDKNKSINFTTLVKKDSKVKESDNANDSNTTFPFKIMKINIVNTNFKLNDLSLAKESTVNINNINGVINTISNNIDDVSFIDILGDINRYGSTSIKGHINLSNPKKYTDMKIDFKNLNLNSYSEYSALFTGYEIESGKLNLDLDYKIKDSKLLSTNNIYIKNITLGNSVSDDKIPLDFMIGLLENSDGVINMKIPIDGDLAKPDFKYKKLVVKVVDNLVTKAITSPFRFLGSAIGVDGTSLESVKFEVGKADILPATKKSLDKLAKIMKQRPKIEVTIYANYDKGLDSIALQKESKEKIKENDLKKLAKRRAEIIQKYLVLNKKIAFSKVIIGEFDDTETDSKLVKTKLEIKVK